MNRSILWLTLLAALVGATACGRIGPGAALRPEAVEYHAGPASNIPASPGYVSPTDDKGCWNAVPNSESGQKLQNDCRSK